MQIMKKKQLKTYCPPKSTLIHVETPSLMDTSFPGQHNPGHHATGPSAAKRSLTGEWSDDEDVSTWETNQEE